MHFIGQFIKQSSSRNLRMLNTVAIVAALMGGAVSAQSLREARPPAEFPPESFTANQYVDSRGCVYVRAGISGATEWVPRVSRTREQLCGFQPTQVAGTTTISPTADAPNPLDTPVAGLPARDATPATAPTEAPVSTAAIVPTPAPATQPAAAVAAAQPVTQPMLRPALSLPTSTANAINPLTGQAIGAQAVTPTAAPVQSARPSPRVITPAAPAPRTLTRAQACEGLSGVQPHLISQRTGAPIDCGGAPEPTVLTRAQACEGLTGIQTHLISQRTGEPIDCGGTSVQIATLTPPVAAAPTTQPATVRMTRAQACADSAATGRQYVSATTGLPIQCGAQTTPLTQIASTFDQLRADFTRPQTAYSNPLDMAPGSTFTPNRRPQVASRSPARYSNPLDSAPGSTADFTPTSPQHASDCARYGMGLSSGVNTTCVPQAPAPAAEPAMVTRARTAPAGQGVFAQITGQGETPFSNPTQTAAMTTPQLPDGYARVWNDGRLNTQRGLPTPAQPTVSAPRVSTRVAPQPSAQAAKVEQITGHRYVQVATFTNRDQAQSVAQALRARGLPMRIGVYEQGGAQMRMVLAGPFASDGQLQSALGAARNAGYTGAFTRR